MNAKNVHDALTYAGYRSQIVSVFDYDFDLNRRFYVVRIYDNINRHIVSLLHSFHCIPVISIFTSFYNGLPVTSTCIDVYPKDMKSFDWEASL